MSKPLSTVYLRTQAARCQRLSRMCMDLSTARDLRLMAEEYLAEAASIEQSARNLERHAEQADQNEKMAWQDNDRDGPRPSLQSRHHNKG